MIVVGSGEKSKGHYFSNKILRKKLKQCLLILDGIILFL